MEMEGVVRNFWKEKHEELSVISEYQDQMHAVRNGGKGEEMGLDDIRRNL